VVGKDGAVDLALLHLVGDIRDLPFVYLGDSDALEVGDWVVAIGSPFGLDHSVSHGMISAKERVLGVGAFDDFIQTDALINPGNSGGPLFDMAGQVVGVNTAIVTRGQGIGFAVPINLVKDLLPNLKVNGHLARGWLGLTVSEQPGGQGAVVEGVYAGSPAAEGGVHPGDRITVLDGKPVESYLQLLRRIALLPPGTRTHFTLVRNGQTRQAEIILSERPAAETMETLATLQEIEPAGLAVQEVTPTLAARLMLPVERGLWVAGVVPGSTADRAGLREGDVIDRANGEEVSDVEGFQKVVSHREGHQITLHFLRGSEPKTLVIGD
jgi:serine protease Do